MVGDPCLRKICELNSVNHLVKRNLLQAYHSSLCLLSVVAVLSLKHGRVLSTKSGDE